MCMKYNILIVVFTETDSTQKYAYYTTDDTIKPGDHFRSNRDGRWVKVLEVRESETSTYNGLKLNKMEKQSKMISGIKEKYMSQFIPERVPNAKMSADGSICVLIGDEYVGIKGEELITYPEEFVMDFPVYSIVKPQDQVREGDIVISGKNFGKVIRLNEDGSIKLLSFSGYTHNKKEVKDFLLGKATVRVLVNMYDTTSGFNPMIFAMASGDKIDLKTLAMMQMMPGFGGGEMSDLLKNPMMMAMMMKGGDRDFLETMMLMEMMNPLKQETPTTEDMMKDLLSEDPEFKRAFVKAMKKRTMKGGEK